MSAGGPFRFWQPSCTADAAVHGLPWAHYMPLGGRRTAWPPRCVIRPTSFYGRFVGLRNTVIVEACIRELLSVFEYQGYVRPFDDHRPLNITFYTNMNFLASRHRLHRYTHRAYRTLAHRFTEVNRCMGPAGGGAHGGTSRLAAGGGGALKNRSSSFSSSGGFAAGRAARDEPASRRDVPAAESEALQAHPGVVDDAAFAKYTLGMATEMLQQVLFGEAPLEDGPTPAVPLNGEHCLQPAPTRCSLGS